MLPSARHDAHTPLGVAAFCMRAASVHAARPGGKLALVLWLLISACEPGAEELPETTLPETEEPAPIEAVPMPDAAVEPRVPRTPPHPEYAPSMIDVVGEPNLPLLADVEQCTACHEDAARQHAAGPHAHASFDNPWYRAVVEDLREEEGFAASHHCAGCHDPLLLLSGAMDRPIEPGDPYTNAGVTCMTCHSITSATTDGNASYVLEVLDPRIPDPNDEDEVAAHRARMAPDVLRTPVLCASCHRGFLHEGSGTRTFFPGIDEAGAWRGSAYGGQHAQRIDDVEARDCRGCHMTLEASPTDFASDAEGMLASHRFAGGHSALAQALGADQLAWVRARSATAATIDVIPSVDGSPLDPGTPVARGADLVLDVVIRNVGTGHRFPGGIRDGRDHRVVLRVTDARGRVLASVDGDDETLVLRTEIVDEDGALETAHRTRRFAALVSDRTIAPRDALMARYELTLPRDAALPLSVRAELVARRHREGLRTLACEASRSERGRAFLRASERPIDGCGEEPLLSLAETVVEVGDDEAGALSWERLYVHGLALLHEVSERLEDSRPSLTLALERAPTERDRARVLLALAELEGRQGRTDEALSLADRAEALVGSHPAIDRVRGRALAQVWRWEEAEVAFTAVAEASPLDTEAFRDLARARGSLGDEAGALAAAVSGLSLLPRDEALLRTQALSLSALHDPRATEARAAFLWTRRPDDETALRFACDRDAECASTRFPVPHLPLP